MNKPANSQDEKKKIRHAMEKQQKRPMIWSSKMIEYLKMLRLPKNHELRHESYDKGELYLGGWPQQVLEPKVSSSMKTDSHHNYV